MLRVKEMDKKVHSAGIIEHSELTGRPIGLREFNSDFLAMTFGGEAFFLLEDIGIATRIEPVSVIYVPAGQRHIYDPVVPAAWQNCWVLFDGARARQAFSEIIPVIGITRLQNISDLKNHWLQMARCMFTHDKLEDEQAFCALHNILIEIKRQNIPGDASQPSSITNNVIDMMHRNLHQTQLSLKSIAIKNGIAPDSLSKRFKRETGMPLYQYFLQLKINVAKSMLANLNYRITDLADFLGIEDQYYFSRLFKKKTGLSPSNYRKQIIMKKQQRQK